MITFQDVTIKYDDFTAVKNLNFEVKDGEFFTFLGPSGCGKTTTLRSLVGLIQPTSGEIYLDDKDITNLPTEKRDIKMVFQSYALFPTMTVYENIAFGLKVKKVEKAMIKQKVADIAKKVDLAAEQLAKKVSELSGGQQQRVAIARALVNQPNILVLDEPLSNLDAKLRVQLRNELKSLQKNFGITTVYVTHDQEEALTLSDRIAVFNKGEIEQIGTPEEIYEQSNSEFVCNFIGENNNITKLVTNHPERFDRLNLEENNAFYSRIEKLKISLFGQTYPLVEDELSFTGKIIDSEYYGIYTKYSIKVEDTVVRAVLKEKLSLGTDQNEKVQVILSQQHILQYK
ncbi:ABC transporter ATP-binding protein [Oceanobacillus arenosus]|uniref:ABC transporter ATP-binding protein n=1 Tax=Oceanobacillus arenosus TaxID=1229153 RepID=A0A3D8Q116_9BACI|nr:ABC transporter ATP-binding protein [Oceanobacillus arenosus]RDW22136.1 ABC transporter ATP-binding protein [Oceanobacillus arenosus]